MDQNREIIQNRYSEQVNHKTEGQPQNNVDELGLYKQLTLQLNFIRQFGLSLMITNTLILIVSLIDYSYYIISTKYRNYQVLLSISVVSGVYALAIEVYGILVLFRYIQLNNLLYIVLIYSSHLIVIGFLFYLEIFEQITDENWVMWVCIVTQVFLIAILIVTTYIFRKIKLFQMQRDYSLMKILINKSTIDFQYDIEEDLKTPFSGTEKCSIDSEQQADPFKLNDLSITSSNYHIPKNKVGQSKININ